MDQNLNLEIVTPQRVLLETEADYVTIPGEIGELGILPGHIPLLTNLQSGVLSYKNGSEEKKIAVHYGYAEVCQDKITILAQTAETSDEINIEETKAAQKEAEDELAELMNQTDQLDRINELQREIAKSITRQNLAQ